MKLGHSTRVDVSEAKVQLGDLCVMLIEGVANVAQEDAQHPLHLSDHGGDGGGHRIDLVSRY